MRRWIPIALTATAFIVLLGACNGENQAYTDACAAGTPEAYRTYVEQYPEGLHIADVRHRLDLADYEVAEKTKTAEAYEKYVADHPDGEFADKARDQARQLAWDKADLANTVDALVAFKNEYGTGAMGIKADTRLEALRYAATSVKIEGLELERVNISGERNGEPNGYALRAKFTNAGERAAKVMKVRVGYVGADGKLLEQRFEYVATPSHPMGLPIPERLREPFKPGEERDFEYLVGDANLPKDWPADLEHVKLEVTEIEFAEG